MRCRGPSPESPLAGESDAERELFSTTFERVACVVDRIRLIGFSDAKTTRFVLPLPRPESVW